MYIAWACFRDVDHFFIHFLQTTDANIRKVLGPTLFHIRFPLIHAVYFTSHISSREILNPQEIIAVYQYYHGKQQANNWKFNTNRRRGYSLHSVIRYYLYINLYFQISEFRKIEVNCFMIAAYVTFKICMSTMIFKYVHL